MLKKLNELITNATPKQQKEISKDIQKTVRKYKKTGKIGTSEPANVQKAVKQAAAIAYKKQEEK